jgi:hypothetical protein
MAKFVSPLLGYNNNVRHKNRVFHIQTEDSGINHPHIITHLFMDGGRILKSVKKSYAEHVGNDGMNDVVRQMMKEQHKAMFIALRDGQFDHLVDPNAAPPKEKDAAPATAPEQAPPTTPDDVASAAAEADVDAAAAAAAAAEAPATVAEPAAAPPAAEPQRVSDRPAAVGIPQAPPAPRLVIVDSDTDEVPATTRQPEPPTAEPALSLDLAGLDKAAPPAAEPAAAPPAALFQANDLPPPPKNLFAKERGTGTYRSLDAEPEKDIGRAPAAKPPAAKPSTSPKPSAPSKSPSPSRVGASRPPEGKPQPRASGEGGRYAPARPAAIFGSANKPPAQSIFSDDLVSDKSLDEVILSYLAEDLEPPRRK